MCLFKIVTGGATDSSTSFLMELLAVPLVPSHCIHRHFWGKLTGLHYVVWRCFTTSGWRTFEWTLRSASCTLFFRVDRLTSVSPRPGMVKLLALSNFPAYVHFVIRVSQDITVCCFVIFNVIGASFSLIECASCNRFLEPNGFSAPILLFTCTIDDATRNGTLVSDALFRGGLICFRIVWSIVLANDCECFCCFSGTWNVLFV